MGEHASPDESAEPRSDDYRPDHAAPVNLFNTGEVLDRPVLGEGAVANAASLPDVEGFAGQFAAEGALAAHEVAQSVANEVASRLTAELDDTRQKLQEIDPSWSGYIEAYLRRHLPDADTQAVASGSLSEWLADKERGATDEQLLGFLKQHYQEVMSQRQDPEVLKFIEEQKVTRLAEQGQAIRAGWLSENARQSAGKLLGAKIVIGDVWDTVMHGHVAFVNPDEPDVIVIAQGGGTTGKSKQAIFQEIDEVVGHEENHLQFLCGIPAWEEELLAEHTDLSLTFGDVDVMDPAERERNGVDNVGRYAKGRALYDTLLQGGRERISPRFATRAYTSGDRNSPEWTELSRLVDESWGVENMRDRVTATIAQNEAAARAAFPNETKWQINNRALIATRKILIEIAAAQKSS